MRNAIVHNLPAQGTVWVTTAVDREGERVRDDHAGVGLGLAIVKSIAQAHDGTLPPAPRPPPRRGPARDGAPAARR